MPPNNFFQSRALDEVRKFREEKAKIAYDVIPRYRRLLRIQGSINKEELHEWTEKAQKEISEIEDCLGKKIDLTTSFAESSKNVVRDSKLAFEKGQMSEKCNVELDLIKIEANRAKESEIKSILSTLIEISGKELVKSILDSLTGSSGPKTSSQDLPYVIDPAIIKACVNFLGMDGKIKPTVTHVINAMEATHQRIQELKKEVKSKELASTTSNSDMINEMKRKREEQRISSVIQGSPGLRRNISKHPVTSAGKIIQLSSNDIPLCKRLPEKKSSMRRLEETVLLPTQIIERQDVSLPGNSKNDVKLPSSSRTRDKKTLTIQVPAYNRKTSPSKEISPSNSSDSSPASQQDIDILLKDLESTRLTNSHLHTEIDDLTSKLKNLVVLKDNLEDTSNQLKCHLLYNANYNQQISAADVKIYFQDIQIYDGIKERRLVKFKTLCYGITIADDFLNMSFKPHLPVKEHIFLLFHSMPRNFSFENQSIYAKEQAQYHVLWLSGQLQSIVNVCSDPQTNRFFTFWLENIINFCPLVGIARASLFLIIANLTMRTDNLSEDGLWWVLHNMVILGKMRNPMNDWEVVEYICFFYFISKGPTENPMMKMIANNQPASFSLIQDLRDKAFMDMIGFLSHEPVQKFIRRQSKDSVFISSHKENRVAILRTCVGNKISEPFEYIWTREEKLVTLSMDGFVMTAEENSKDGMILYYKAKGDFSKNWFPYKMETKGDGMEYFSSNHLRCIQEAVESYHIKCGYNFGLSNETRETS
ncbi:hypothetical protein H4I95_05683 [Botrytis cinerea]